MQERRILNCLIDQSKIPSSATLVTSDNYTTISGNVIYVPLNQLTITTTGSFSPSIGVRGKNNSPSYVKSIGELEYINNNYYIRGNSDSAIKPGFYRSYTTSNGTKMWYLNLPTFGCSGQPNNFGLGEGIPISGNYSSVPYVKYYPEDTIYFSKIKFSSDIIINSFYYTGSSNDVTNFCNDFSFYIDTEN